MNTTVECASHADLLKMCWALPSNVRKQTSQYFIRSWNALYFIDHVRIYEHASYVNYQDTDFQICWQASPEAIAKAANVLLSFREIPDIGAFVIVRIKGSFQ